MNIVECLGARGAMTRYAGSAAFFALLAAVPVAAQNYAVLSTNLFGENVPGGGADTQANADFDGEIDLAKGELCYFMELEGLANADGAHVHRAKSGDTGPVVVDLTLPPSGSDEVCLKLEPSLLRQLADRPGDYYVDIHSVDKPNGAVRGQFD